MSDFLQIWADSFPSLALATIGVTIPLSLIAFAIALVLAVITARARVSRFRLARAVAWFYVWVFRGTPLLVQLFIVFFGLPRVGITFNAWTAGIITLALNTGAYASEGIRAAESSIPAGQWEAARVLHLTRWETLRYVIAPQMWRIALPPLSNEFINIFKSTSLVSTITLADVFQVGQQITARIYEPLAVYTEVALIYLLISTLLTWIQGRLEHRLSRYVAVAK